MEKGPWRHGEDHVCLAEVGTQDSQDPGVLSPILSTDQAEGWPVLGQQLSPRAPAWELVASEVATIRSRLVPSHPHPSRADKHRGETK